MIELSNDFSNCVADLPTAFGTPVASGLIRVYPEDFQVDEIPLVEADGQGEHVLLQVEKRLCNTEWVARQLARLAGVPAKDVSYAGLKDRNAVTRQWFSVRLAGKAEPEWPAEANEGWRVVAHARHSRKLRRGALRGNAFQIRVREFIGERAALEARLERIRVAGIPNYFGEQRFGHDGGNLAAAQALFAGRSRRIDRQQRGLYLSAARSLLFNRVLAVRVGQGSWNQLLEGERVMLDGSASSFHAQQIDEELQRRLQAMDVHPSGPLWGRNNPSVTAEAARVEAETLTGYEQWQRGLERAGAEGDRRALRAPVCDLSWALEQGDLVLSFSLPKGAYATALLRECLDYRDAASRLRESST